MEKQMEQRWNQQQKKKMEKTTDGMEQHWGQQQEHEIKQQLESNGSTNGHQKWNNWDNEQKDG